MRALTVVPHAPDSAVLAEVDEPPPSDGALLVQTRAVGVCGTDRDIISGAYGAAPADSTRLIIGHESLGEVLDAPASSGFAPGDLVVGIVRRPDPVPCSYCAVGEWDMCRNGQYTERGIKGRHGYCAERFRLEPEFAIKIDPALGDAGVLVEPASVVAKAWEHADRFGHRSAGWKPRTALVTGAGPIGLLAALLASQRGLTLHVFDRVADGPKPALVRELGAVYHAGTLPALDPDITIECTGATAVIADVVSRSAPSGIVCLAGLSSGGHAIDFDLGGMNRQMVLENDILFGSVNANRRHYLDAVRALAMADRTWLSRLITRRVALDDWQDAFVRHPHDVKVVVDFAMPAS